jgi:adenosylmethionine-8-amino-7-oxononanoate aminotransferase
MDMWNTARLLSADRKHLVHSLHHPEDHAKPHIWVEGKGVMLTDADGREYIDGLACLWNVYVGHGRRELAEAAAAQMTKLAFANSFVGASNAPAIQLAQRLAELAYPNLVATFFARARSRPPGFSGKRRGGPRRSRSCRASMAIMGSPWRR